MRVVRLAPEAKDAEYSYGEQLVRESKGQSEIVVSYHDATTHFLVFNLSVENKGSEPITFDPASCLLVPDNGPVRSAIDPEMQLLSMDVDNLRRKRKGEMFTWIGTGLLVGGLALEAAGSVDDLGLAGDALTEAETVVLAVADETSFVLLQAAQVANDRVVAVDNDEIPVPENRRFWLDHSLRITTIQPGEVAVGKVVFKRNDAASSLNFQIMVAGSKFEIPFRQMVFGSRKELPVKEESL